MDYLPKDYHARICAYEEILSRITDLNNIDLPDVEDVDLRSTQKELSSIAKDIIGVTEGLVDDIWSDVHTDLEENINIYVNQVNQSAEEGVFPFADWNHCVSFKTKTKLWNINYQWLEDATSFTKDSPQKIELFCDNITEFLWEMQKNNWKEISHSLLKVKELIIKEGQDNFYSELLFKKASIRYNTQGQTKDIVLSDWTIYASLELANNWGTTIGNKLWEDFKVKIKDSPNNEIIRNSLVQKVLLDKDNAPKRFLTKVIKNGVTYISNVNFDEIFELIKKDKLDNTNLTNLILEKLGKIIDSYFYGMEATNKAKQEYNVFVKTVETYDLTLKLANNLNEKDSTVIRHKL